MLKISAFYLDKQKNFVPKKDYVACYQLRLEKAAEEMEYGSKAENFDLVITNDTVENAVSQLREFIIVHIEEMKRFKKLLSKT